VNPVFDLDPTGGQVMITRFECPNLPVMMLVMLLHGRIKRQVARRAEGFIGAVMLREWRARTVLSVSLWRDIDSARTVLSVSLWRDIDSVYAMGEVPRHVHASRLPARLGIRTRAGVFCYAGDWRRVMFGAGQPNPSPLTPPAGGR
jgi:hypothetical protein